MRELQTFEEYRNIHDVMWLDLDAHKEYIQYVEIAIRQHRESKDVNQ